MFLLFPTVLSSQHPFKYIFETEIEKPCRKHGNKLICFWWSDSGEAECTRIMMFQFLPSGVALGKSMKIIVSLSGDNSSNHFIEILWVINKVSKCFGTQT